jgi:flavodoxin
MGRIHVDILIVYGSQYGNTQRIAQAMAAALQPEHAVRVMQASVATGAIGDGVDLLFVGAPTQMRGLRLLARPFLDGLEDRGFRGTPAAAFDTRLDVGPQTLESVVIARRLEAAGCLLVCKPQSFVVVGLEGPLATGEEARSAAWALAVARSVVAPV